MRRGKEEGTDGGDGGGGGGGQGGSREEQRSGSEPTNERASVHKGARAGHQLTTTTRRKCSEMATAALAAATMKRQKVAVAYEENARAHVRSPKGALWLIEEDAQRGSRRR